MITIKQGMQGENQFLINADKTKLSDKKINFDFFDSESATDIDGNDVLIRKYIGTWNIGQLEQIIKDAQEKIDLIIK